MQAGINRYEIRLIWLDVNNSGRTPTRKLNTSFNSKKKSEDWSHNQDIKGFNSSINPRWMPK